MFDVYFRNVLNPTVTCRLLATANITAIKDNSSLKAESNTNNKVSCFVHPKEWVEGTGCLEKTNHS